MSKLTERFITPTAIGTFDTSAHLKRLVAARGEDVFSFVDDFTRSNSAAADAITGATVTLVEAGAGESTVAYADAVGGVLRISADANDNDGVNVQFNPEAFLLAEGFKYFYFGCRVKISEATQSDLFIGLSVTTTDALGGVTDSIGFRKVDGATALTVVVEKGSTETVTTVAASIGTGYRFLELVHDGSTLEAFVDGVSAGTIALTNFPDDEELKVVVHALAGAAAASLVCDVDLIRVFQIGGRAALGGDLVLGDLTVVTSNSDLALSLEEAKRQVRRFDADEDPTLQELIRESSAFVETETRRQLLTTTYDLRLPGFPCENWLELPKPPLQSVTSVSYYDATGAVQTLATDRYRVHAPGDERGARGRITLVEGAAWPDTVERDDAVIVRFVAGYGDAAASVPAILRRAMKLLVSHWFETREPTSASTQHEVPFGVVSICAKYRSRPVQRAA